MVNLEVRIYWKHLKAAASYIFCLFQCIDVKLSSFCSLLFLVLSSCYKSELTHWLFLDLFPLISHFNRMKRSQRMKPSAQMGDTFLGFFSLVGKRRRNQPWCKHLWGVTPCAVSGNSNSFLVQVTLYYQKTESF